MDWEYRLRERKELSSRDTWTHNEHFRLVQALGGGFPSVSRLHWPRLSSSQVFPGHLPPAFLRQMQPSPRDDEKGAQKASHYRGPP